MTDTVVCIGNAIVDILTRVDDEFLTKHALDKGAMILVDETTSQNLYADMPVAIERSGGSAGNTAAGLAMLGGNAAYIGKVKDDQLGRIFSHDMRATGVGYTTAPAVEGPATATSMILVTPDAERTMNTYLGACTSITIEDIDPVVIEAAAITYVEGYLWDTQPMKAAVTRAIDVAKTAGKKFSLSLSDSFCVGRFQEEFRALVEDKVDILFANEDEITALYQADNLDDALDQLADRVEIAAITRGAAGAVIVHSEGRIIIDAVPTEVVDTTGAGDLFAAGFLYGLTAGHTLEDAGRIGAAAAASVIAQIGPRPDVDLKALAAECVAK